MVPPAAQTPRRHSPHYSRLRWSLAAIEINLDHFVSSSQETSSRACVYSQLHGMLSSRAAQKMISPCPWRICGTKPAAGVAMRSVGRRIIKSIAGSNTDWLAQVLLCIQVCQIIDWRRIALPILLGKCPQKMRLLRPKARRHWARAVLQSPQSSRAKTGQARPSQNSLQLA